MLINKKSQSAVVDYPEHTCLVSFGRGIRELEPMFSETYTLCLSWRILCFRLQYSDRNAIVRQHLLRVTQ